MLAARVDEKVLGYLGRALSMELSAVQQYTTQARLVGSWGLSEAAENLRREAEEELQHADRIIERMLAIGVAPGGSQLRPVKLAGDLAGLLLINQQMEAQAIQLYQLAVRHSAQVGDHDSRLFFEALLKEEQHHHAELADWLNRLQVPQQATHARRNYP